MNRGVSRGFGDHVSSSPGVLLLRHISKGRLMKNIFSSLVVVFLLSGSILSQEIDLEEGGIEVSSSDTRASLIKKIKAEEVE